MAYDKYEDFTKRAELVKVLRDKTFKIASNPKYDEYEKRLVPMVYKFFDKKSKGSGINSKSNQKLAYKLHKPIVRKFKRRKVSSLFKDKIWGADLADIQLISTYLKGIGLLLCVIDLFSKYAWVVPLKDEKGITIINAFQYILGSLEKKNKIWVDQGSEFYNSSFKKCSKDNDIKMYSTDNEDLLLLKDLLGL